MPTRMFRRADWLPLAGIVLLAAALRLPTLGSQSLWFDEAVTLQLVASPVGDLFDGLESAADANPPLYHLWLWGWVKVIGSGDAALRSISALAGIAIVRTAYLAASELSSRRAGLIAAALVSTSPLMIFFSQEARPYALSAFLTALSFLFLARTLSRGGWKNLAAWAIASLLAIATTYLAGLVVAAEALVLLWLAPGQRARIAVAISAIAAGVLPLLLLALAQLNAIEQREGPDWVHRGSLESHLALLPEWFTVGVGRPGPILLITCVALITAALALVAVWGDDREKRAALVAWAVFTGALVMSALVTNYNARYLVPAWAPLAILAGIGFGTARAGRWGLGCAGALCLIWLALGVAMQLHSDLMRPNWRGLAQGLGRAPAPRLISLSDGDAGRPLVRYLDRARRLEVGESAEVREIVYVRERDPRLRPCALWAIEVRACDRPVRPIVTPPGFRFIRQTDVGQFRLNWLASHRLGRVHATGPGVFVQVAG